jgi:hypothetical protein
MRRILQACCIVNLYLTLAHLITDLPKSEYLSYKLHNKLTLIAGYRSRKFVKNLDGRKIEKNL